MKKILTVVGVFTFSVLLFLLIMDMGHVQSPSLISRVQYKDGPDSAASYNWHEQLMKLIGLWKAEGTLLLASDSEDSDERDNPEGDDEAKDGRFWSAPELG